MSIEITVKVSVPEGESCRYPSGCPCDHLITKPAGMGTPWCSLFDDEPINKLQKCPACLKACEEAEDQ